MHPRDNRFNTPAEMFARLIFVARFFLFFGGFLFSLFAVVNASVFDALKAICFFSAMVTGHIWLKRSGKLEECDRSLEQMFSGTDDSEDDALETLLQRRDALEEKRGTPGFDPWEVQAVRRQISDYVRQHPESTAMLDGPR
ncbi:MAG: hypothetical protein ABW223_00675 [Rariglobus sp.]